MRFVEDVLRKVDSQEISNLEVVADCSDDWQDFRSEGTNFLRGIKGARDLDAEDRRVLISRIWRLRS